MHEPNHRMDRAMGKELKEVACTFSRVGDTNGVFYCIGTQYGKEPYSNPQSSGDVVARPHS